jgi:hypothetical protein
MSLSRAMRAGRKPLVAPAATQPPAKFGDVLASWAGRAGVAIVSGLGLAGSMAVLGGAIAWTRFDAAGLPANQAVDAVPRHELIVIGAAALIPFALLGLAVVIGLFALDPRGTISALTLIGLGFALGVGIRHAQRTALESGAVTFVVVLSIGLTLAVVAIAHVTGQRFAWFGAAVFAAVIVYGAVLSYLIQKDDARVQPMVVLRGKEMHGLMGIYVATSDNRIYLGRLRHSDRGRAAGLFVIPRTAAMTYAVGRSTTMRAVGKTDVLLLRRLKRDRVVLPKAAKPKPKPSKSKRK